MLVSFSRDSLKSAGFNLRGAVTSAAVEAALMAATGAAALAPRPGAAATAFPESSDNATASLSARSLLASSRSRCAALAAASAAPAAARFFAALRSLADMLVQECGGGGPWRALTGERAQQRARERARRPASAGANRRKWRKSERALTRRRVADAPPRVLRVLLCGELERRTAQHTRHTSIQLGRW